MYLSTSRALPANIAAVPFFYTVYCYQKDTYSGNIIRYQLCVREQTSRDQGQDRIRNSKSNAAGNQLHMSTERETRRTSIGFCKVTIIPDFMSPVARYLVPPPAARGPKGLPSLRIDWQAVVKEGIRPLGRAPGPLHTVNNQMAIN